MMLKEAEQNKKIKTKHICREIRKNLKTVCIIQPYVRQFLEN